MTKRNARGAEMPAPGAGRPLGGQLDELDAPPASTSNGWSSCRCWPATPTAPTTTSTAGGVRRSGDWAEDRRGRRWERAGSSPPEG